MIPMRVTCLTCMPFWPVSSVGIRRVCAHRPRLDPGGRFTPKAECGPAGSTRSSVAIGVAGSYLNATEVMPLTMFVCPSRSISIPSPRRTITSAGNATTPCETR